MRPPWDRDAASLDPVFIVGDLRSGTSILYRSIQSHPRFLPAEGLSLVESNAVDQLLRLRTQRDVSTTTIASFVLGVGALTSVAADVEGLNARRSFVRGLARGSIVRLPLWLAAGEHLVIRRYFLEAAKRRGADRVIEKSTRNIRWVPHLAAAFPRARFIFIMRHPLDALSSWWRRAGADPVYSGWGNISIGGFCDHWESAIMRAIKLARREPRLRLIRYEDLTRRTEETIRSVLDHVGENFHESCLLGSAMEIPDGLRGSPRTEAIQTADPLLFRPMAENTKRWSDYIDAGSAARVERRLARAMTAAGYRPVASD